MMKFGKIFMDLKKTKTREKISLPVGCEPTSPSFRGRCLHHLDDGKPISFTAFSFILLDVTMFQHARSVQRLDTIIIKRPTG